MNFSPSKNALNAIEHTHTSGSNSHVSFAGPQSLYSKQTTNSTISFTIHQTGNPESFKSGQSLTLQLNLRTKTTSKHWVLIKITKDTNFSLSNRTL